MPAAPTLRSADHPGRGYTCVGTRLLAEWVADQTLPSAADAAIGDACGVSRTAANQWRDVTKYRPRPKHWEHIARITGGRVPVEAWESWELLGAEPETPPASEDRPTPRALGTTHEELRATVQEIDAVRAKGGLTPNQDAALLGKRASVLAALARLEDRTAIEDHPEFDAFLEALLSALERTLVARGIDATGARTEFASHLEAIEAERAKRAA